MGLSTSTLDHGTIGMLDDKGMLDNKGTLVIKGKRFRNIAAVPDHEMHPMSSVLHPMSSVPCPPSCIPRPASCIPCPASRSYQNSKKKSKIFRILTSLKSKNGFIILETGIIMESAIKIINLPELEELLLKMGQCLLMVASRMVN